VTLERTSYYLLFKQEVVAATSYCHIFLLTTFLAEAFVRIVIFTIYIDYTIIICINNNNNKIINNNLWKTQRTYLLLKIPMGM
jgi:hypothetical protein